MTEIRMKHRELDSIEREAIRAVKSQAQALIDTINRACPRSAETTLSVRKVQEASFWAVDAITAPKGGAV